MELDEDQDFSGPLGQAKRYMQGMSEHELDRCVRDLVRLALFSELKRLPIKRDDINKKVLKDHIRAFHGIFALANDQLNNVFGLNLVELPSAAPKRKKATASASQSSSSASNKRFVVVSTLEPSKRLEVLTMGSESSIMTTLTIILSLIFAHGHSVPEDANVQKDTLLATLGELGFKEGSLPQVAHHHGVTSLDQLLNLFVKQLYLEKNSRSDRESPIYTWGPRAKVEFPSDHMVHFILSMYKEDANCNLDRLALDLEKMAEPLQL